MTLFMQEIITTKILREKLLDHLQHFGEMVKFVVDIEKEILALGGELHADCEDILLKDGSRQQNLWGANLYPLRDEDERIEYTSLINIKPSVGNRNMEIQDEMIRNKVREIAERLLLTQDDHL